MSNLNEKFLKDIKGDLAVKDYLSPTNYYISVDCGSTETRSFLYNKANFSGKAIGIDSLYSIIENDISNVTSKTTSLYDNLEIEIEDNTFGKDDENKMFEYLKVVKAGLMVDLNKPTERVTSDIGKASQAPTYINTLINIGLRIYLEGVESASHSVPRQSKIYLTLGLPSEDLKSAVRVNNIKKKLAGSYTFKLTRLNFKASFVLAEEDIILHDESQAVLDYWYSTSNEDASNYPTAIIIDGGGRSIDYSMVKNGRP